MNAIDIKQLGKLQMKRSQRVMGNRMHSPGVPSFHNNMRLGRLVTVLMAMLGCSFANGQVSVNANELLQASLTALGNPLVSDILLTGSVSLPPASDGNQIPATLRAEASGAIEITYQTSPAPQVESRTVGSNRTWSGNWRDVTGKLHTIAGHNMMTETAWFFPLFCIQRALNGVNPALQVAYIGQESYRGTAAQHVRMFAASSSSPLLQKLSQSDLYLDAVTLLPMALLYNDHPDGNALLDIPVTVLFSNYTTLNGMLLPTHVQQLRNNALFVDLSIQDIQINTHAVITPLQ